MAQPVQSNSLLLKIRNVAFAATAIGVVFATIGFIAAMHGGNPSISSVVAYTGVAIGCAGFVAVLVSIALLSCKKQNPKTETFTKMSRADLIEAFRKIGKHNQQYWSHEVGALVDARKITERNGVIFFDNQRIN